MMDALLQNRRDSKAQEKPGGEQKPTTVGTARRDYRLYFHRRKYPAVAQEAGRVARKVSCPPTRTVVWVIGNFGSSTKWRCISWKGERTLSLSPNGCAYAIKLHRFKTVFERHPYGQVRTDGSDYGPGSDDLDVRETTDGLGVSVLSFKFSLQFRGSK